MALTIVEAAKLNPGDVLRQAIVEMYARTSEVLRTLPFESIPGNALKYNREDILPGVGFRGVNEAFPESVGVLNPITESLVIAGGTSTWTASLWRRWGPTSAPCRKA